MEDLTELKPQWHRTLNPATDNVEKGPFQRVRGSLDWQPIQDTQTNGRQLNALMKRYRRARVAHKPNSITIDCRVLKLIWKKICNEEGFGQKIVLGRNHQDSPLGSVTPIRLSGLPVGHKEAKSTSSHCPGSGNPGIRSITELAEKSMLMPTTMT